MLTIEDLDSDSELMALEDDRLIRLPALESRGLGMVKPVLLIPEPRPVTVNSRKVYITNAEAVRYFSIRKRAPSPDEGFNVTALEAVIDLVLRDDLKKASARAYRSAMLWKLAYDRDQCESARTAYAVLERWRPGATPLHEGAPRRSKGIPEADFHELHGLLGDMAVNSVWAQRAQHWIVATLAVGARPIEWLDARWEDDTRQAMLLNTAKGKLEEPAFQATRAAGSAAGRSGIAPSAARAVMDGGDEELKDEVSGEDVLRVVGNIRRVPVIRAFDRMTIDAHMASFTRYLKEQGAQTESERYEAFRRFRDAARLALRRACLALWEGKKLYGLNSMRQQFQANQRALHKGDLGAVRSLMGHTTHVSGGHYGRASQAHSRFKEKAATNEIVQQTVTPAHLHRAPSLTA